MIAFTWEYITLGVMKINITRIYHWAFQSAETYFIANPTKPEERNRFADQDILPFVEVKKTNCHSLV
jgi:hypothetical protein